VKDPRVRRSQERRRRANPPLERTASSLLANLLAPQAPLERALRYCWRLQREESVWWPHHPYPASPPYCCSRGVRRGF
jgi:hypothetical protein